MRKLIYVGYRADNHKHEVFRPASTPTIAEYGKRYGYAVGPFRTVRGANFFAKYGRGNPHVYHVNDAERIAKRLEYKG